MNKVNDLLNYNTKLLHETYELKKKIKEIENKITKNEKQIWENCTHEWIRDPNANFDDICKHYCKKCKLWRNESWYK